MPAKKSAKSKPEIPPLPATEKKTKRMWATHGGMDDVNYQRGAEVTLWTIMGGLASAVLVTELDNLWTQMQAGRWHLGLFFAGSILSISLSWTMQVWGSMVLRLPLSVVNTLLIIGTSFALVIQCLMVTSPVGWFVATCVSALILLFRQIYFMRSGAWGHFSAEAIVLLKKNLWVYGLWPLICVAGALHIHLAPAMLTETIWGVIVLVVLIDAFFRQNRGMERERKDLGIL